MGCLLSASAIDATTLAFRFYQRHWRTLLAITAVVVVPLTLLQYLFGDLIRTQGEEVANGVVETASWAVGIAGLVAALAALLMFLVLTSAITRAVAAEVAGEDPGGVGSGAGNSGHPAEWALVGVLLYLDLRARKEALTLEALRADLQASAA